MDRKFLKKNGEEVFKYKFNLDDFNTYGPVFYHMNYRDAVKAEIMPNYRILLVGIDSDEIKKVISNSNFIKKTSVEEWASHYSLVKAMKQIKATHALTFHPSIKKSKIFKEKHEKIDRRAESFHVDGKQNYIDIEMALENFKHSPRAVLSNKTFVSDRLDVSNVDCFYFDKVKQLDLNFDKIMKLFLKKNGKNHKSIEVFGCPIYFKKNQSLMRGLKNGCFDDFSAIMKAMVDLDPGLAEYLIKTVWSNPKGKQLKSTKKSDLVQFLNVDDNTKEFIYNEIYKRQIISKWRPFDQARDYVHRLELSPDLIWKTFSTKKLTPCRRYLMTYLIGRI